MTYEESFLSTADAEGNVPQWAFLQIIDEHGGCITDFTDFTPQKDWFNGEAILNYLGY